MDKKDRANKRRQDKHHKKPPPSAVAKETSSKKDQKSTPQQTSAPLIVYDDPYSRRPIEPNWSRDRDLPPAPGLGDSEDDDDNQLYAADLEKLLQLPPSASGHFFLSTEKHWAEDQTAIVSGQHFRIDSRQLNLGLGTIPFHERNGYPAELFSKREVDSMTLKASFESKKYQDYCNKQAAKMSEAPPPRPVPCLIGPGAFPPRSEPQDVHASPQRPVPCLIGPGALPPGPEPQDVQPPRPVPCLIGPGALPPRTEPEDVQPTPPRPVPCLIGPMALPPELRHDPNVTGSYASARGGVDVVPIGDDPVPVARQDRSSAASSTATTDGPATGETKEDIQAWLDDILDA